MGIFYTMFRSILWLDRPDGKFSLYGGDGSYGKLAYFYKKAWRPVCYPPLDVDRIDFNLFVAPYVCQQFGYRYSQPDSFFLFCISKNKQTNKYTHTQDKL